MASAAGEMGLVREPGPLTDEILLFGSRQVFSYLVRGEVYAWIGGGTAWDVPRLEDQLDRFGVDRARIRYLVVSHAHHDHCGAVPYLVRRYPWLEVVAAPYCAELLAKEKPVALMRELNQRTLERVGRPEHHAGVSLAFEAIHASPLADGSTLELGRGVSLRLLTTPGHSRCSASVYSPELEALFPGDSIPYPEKDRSELTVTANHDFGDYIESLEKLAPLATEVVAYEHGGALVGVEARDVVARGLEAAGRQRQRLRRRFAELGAVDLLVEEIAEKYGRLELFRLVPADALRAIVGRMVRSAVGD